MSELVDVFLSILLLSFAVFTLLSGLFAAYVGAGKSRVIGILLVVIALTAGFFFAMFTWGFIPGLTPVLWDPDIVLRSLVAVLAATVGGIASLLVFLLAIMKA